MSAIPNATSLFDRIEPFLVTAELWLTDNLIPHDLLVKIVEDTVDQAAPIYFLPRRVVAMHAWRAAIPAVDIVVGQNGLGVVESNSIKPASKAKVDHLIESAGAQFDAALDALVSRLPLFRPWLPTRQADRFRSTVFPDFAVLRSLGVSSGLWDAYTALIPKIQAVELTIADRWISREILELIRRFSLEGTRPGLPAPPHVLAAVRDELRAAVIAVMKQKQSPAPGFTDPFSVTLPPLEQCVNIIRSDHALERIWRQSPAGQAFSQPAFRNRPDSPAFVF